ncbi:MAG TPA: toll/interleukin-1 receptor domain-containing protein [Ktedonobacterales bacterium]
MPEQIRVFVSHHHSLEEDAFTARLVADLEAAGADVWMDDVRITSDDFIKKINEGLAGRQWLVLVMTPDSLRSPWVQAEVNAALLQVRQGRMLGVIPLVAQPCNEADIPPL